MKIGLVLGSGAARGWAHVGVLQVLQEAGIEPDIVCGTSVGALVGGAWLTGQLDPLQAWAKSIGLFGVLSLLDVTFSKGGLVTVEKAFERFRNEVTDVPMEQLRKPFGVVATELATGREVWIREGPMLHGIHASVAIPGLIPSVLHEGRWLVDGALVNPVPVSLARAMGADLVIAVNLNGDMPGLPRLTRHAQPRRIQVPENPLAQFGLRLGETTRALAQQFVKPKSPVPNVVEALAGAVDIMQDRITRSRLAGEPADVVIAPPIGHVGMLDFDQSEELIRLGRDAALAMRPAIDLAMKRAHRARGGALAGPAEAGAAG
ncbi:MAG TPA: patatin-like phospholipase family protein [Azospirillaceae bacterium]|nr:patatin-like phospholipase family protein [Azospirillaceae bacterium]